MPYYTSEKELLIKDTVSGKLVRKKLMVLFSSYPTSIVYYFINIYLSIFNNNLQQLPFYKLLTNITVPGLIDESKYTAYNQVFPFNDYNEINGNDLLVAS